jgi:hypothetical protein
LFVTDFALNCGAKSCPPLRTFSFENIENELDFAAESFIDEDVIIDLSKRQVAMNLTIYCKLFIILFICVCVCLLIVNDRLHFQNYFLGTKWTLEIMIDRCYFISQNLWINRKKTI